MCELGLHFWTALAHSGKVCGLCLSSESKSQPCGLITVCPCESQFSSSVKLDQECLLHTVAVEVDEVASMKGLMQSDSQQTHC
jgi:hypothetical protein